MVLGGHGNSEDSMKMVAVPNSSQFTCPQFTIPPNSNSQFPLLTIFPYGDRIAADHKFFLDLQTVPLLTYLFFVLFAYLALNRYIDTDFPSTKANRWLETAVLSIAVVGNLLIVVYAISSTGEVSIITFLDKIFSNTTYVFWWVIGSLGVLFYASR